MAEVALLPLRAAVTVAVPRNKPTTGTATGTGTARVPGETETDAGTEATVGSLLVTLMAVALDWLALIVAVRVPLLPWVSERLVGSRLVRIGPGQRLEVADAVEVRVPPSGPLSVQTRLLPLKGTRKAPWSYGVRPGWKTVVCPRSWGVGVNLLFGPTGMVMGTVFSFLYPYTAVYWLGPSCVTHSRMGRTGAVWDAARPGIMSTRARRMVPPVHRNAARCARMRHLIGKTPNIANRFGVRVRASSVPPSEPRSPGQNGSHT
jgi:hypothetical protein